MYVHCSLNEFVCISMNFFVSRVYLYELFRWRFIAVGFDGASPTQILPNVQSLHYYKLCNGFVPEALVHTYFLSRSGFTGPLSGLRSGITFRWAKKCTGSRACGGATSNCVTPRTTLSRSLSSSPRRPTWRTSKATSSRPTLTTHSSTPSST